MSPFAVLGESGSNIVSAVRPSGHGLPHIVRIQFLHCGVPAADLHGGKQRPLDPGAKQTPSHRCVRPIKHPEQCALFLPVPQRFREFQVAAGRPVHFHGPPVREHVQAVDVVQIEFLCLFDIGQQRADRADRCRTVSEPAAVHILQREALAQVLCADCIVKAVSGTLRHGVELPRQKTEDLPVLFRAGGKYGLLR